MSFLKMEHCSVNEKKEGQSHDWSSLLLTFYSDMIEDRLGECHILLTTFPDSYDYTHEQYKKHDQACGSSFRILQPIGQRLRQGNGFGCSYDWLHNCREHLDDS